MELTLLGTGTCAPNPSRAPACYFLSIGPHKIIVDPGPGAVNRMVQAGIDPFSADTVFLSHHHPDHCSDLVPFLFSYRHCVKMTDRRDIKIVAPQGFQDVFDGLMSINAKWTLSDDYSVSVSEVMNDEWEEAGARFRAAPMLHGANGVGYRFVMKGGPALVYSGDTGYCGELIELATGADALLVECSLPDGHDAEGHMRPSEVAQSAIQAGVGKLILTHFYPIVNTDEAVGAIREAGYEGEIIVGEDGMKITI